VPVGIYRTTPSGKMVDVNSAMVEILRFPDRSAPLGINAASLYVDPEDRERGNSERDASGGRARLPGLAPHRRRRDRVGAEDRAGRARWRRGILGGDHRGHHRPATDRGSRASLGDPARLRRVGQHGPASRGWRPTPTPRCRPCSICAAPAPRPRSLPLPPIGDAPFRSSRCPRS
jgi:PAS domain-containing protein